MAKANFEANNTMPVVSTTRSVNSRSEMSNIQFNSTKGNFRITPGLQRPEITQSPVQKPNIYVKKLLANYTKRNLHKFTSSVNFSDVGEMVA
jgi:hypothetical protein